MTNRINFDLQGNLAQDLVHDFPQEDVSRCPVSPNRAPSADHESNSAPAYLGESEDSLGLLTRM